ncbi:hypothetical protein H6785_01430 [Candidatus Nomurabacteria bacterium]|nr:hypothetical protein [Candidatus Nomurabacteria bacterium]
MISFAKIQTEKGLQAAVELVRKVYLARGYLSSDSVKTDMISKYLGKEQTVTFSANRKGLMVGTISVVADSDAGFPMDDLYRQEIKSYRDQGAKLGEVCQFAVDKKSVELDKSLDEKEVSLGLFSSVLNYGLANQFHYFIFAVNPKHAPFYKVLGCEQIGEEKSYGSVNGAPAIPYILDLNEIKTDVKNGTLKNMILRKILS